MSQDFYFLLMPGFSAIGFISALEPLRVANRFRGELYRWHILSADGGAVLASNGMSVNADAALEPLKKGATLLVVAGFEPLQFATPLLEHWLRRLDHDGVTLGAIDTGACVLAEAIKVTRRQLERLFRLHLNDTPSNFYLGLRLEKARKLLRQSGMSVLEVSIACGFESPSYFTRSYRARFAKCPREDRRREMV